LVVVILIVGILAVVAVPKYLDLSQQAYMASGESTIAAINSASAINFAAWTANGKAAGTSGAVPLSGQKCSVAIPLLLSSNPMLSNPNFTYGIPDNTIVGTNGITFSACTISWPGSANQAVTLIVTATS